jgi:nitrite reductase (NADH) small subunit
VWHRIAKKGDIGEGKAQLVELEGRSIAVFHERGKLYAVDNKCPHRGGPLVQGHVEEGKVTCPWHAWQFDIETGVCDTLAGAPQKTYPLKIEDGQILIEL